MTWRILELVDETVPHTLTKILATEGVDCVNLLSDPCSYLAELQKQAQNTYEQTNTMVEESMQNKMDSIWNYQLGLAILKNL